MNAKLEAIDPTAELWDWAGDDIDASHLSGISQRVAQLRQPASDLFDLRQAIMRYANPLRVKILLFSLLHERYQHDSVEQALLLKSYELDKLLSRTLKAYRRLYLLSSNLRRAAEQLDNPEEYTQTAMAILRAVKPFYRDAISSKDLPEELAPLSRSL